MACSMEQQHKAAPALMQWMLRRACKMFHKDCLIDSPSESLPENKQVSVSVGVEYIMTS